MIKSWSMLLGVCSLCQIEDSPRKVWKHHEGSWLYDLARKLEAGKAKTMMKLQSWKRVQHCDQGIILSDAGVTNSLGTHKLPIS